MIACVGAILFINACAGTSNDELEARVETLENATIESLKTQIQSISGSLEEYKSTQDQLAGYVTDLQAKIGQLDGQGYADLKSQVDGLKNRADAFDTAIANLEAYINQKGADLQQWVKDYYTSQEKFNELKGTVTGISGSITEIVSRLNGLDQATAGIAQDLKDKTDKLTTDLTACRTDIDRILGTLEELGNSIDALEQEVAAIISAVQSVVVVPDYTDGSVKMTDGAVNVLRFEVYPLTAAQKLVDIGVSAFSLDFVETETKSSIFTNIPITGVSFDGEVVSVTADCSNLLGKVVDGQQSVNARLLISDGTITRSSEYFLLTYRATEVAIELLPVSGLTECHATLNARVDMAQSENDDVFYGFVYSEQREDLFYNLEFSHIADTLKTRTISVDHVVSLTTAVLNSASKYYYRSFVSKNNVLYYSSIGEFTTQMLSATVETLAPTDIDVYTATMNGRVIIKSEENLSKSAWFLYSDSYNTLEGLKEHGWRIEADIREDGVFNAITGKDVYYENATYGLMDQRDDEDTTDRLKIGTVYYYVAVTQVHQTVLYGDIVSFLSGDYTYEAGEVVDLGLSVKWSSINLGATTPEENGAYFAWGETIPKTVYNWRTYKWSDKPDQYDSGGITKYNGTDNKTVLDPEDDAAHVILGDKWRMPTNSEWSELVKKCSWTKTKIAGVDGWKAERQVGETINHIFLPISGFKGYSSSRFGLYWSSSRTKESSGEKVYLLGLCDDFDPAVGYGSFYYVGDCGRYLGFTIRPVYDDGSQ